MDFDTLVILVTLTAVSCLATDDMYRCPDDLYRGTKLKTFRDHCYQFYEYERFWTSAQSVCRRKNGHLVVIKDQETQNFIIRSLQSLHWPYNGVWIGASDRDREMDWRWVTGEKIAWNNFASGQPNCKYFCVEDCAQLRLDKGGKWHDYPCGGLSFHYSFICQYKMKPLTTTSTTTTTATTTTTTTTTTVASTVVKTLATNSTTQQTTTAAPPEVVVVKQQVLHGKKNLSAGYQRNHPVTTPTTAATTTSHSGAILIHQGMIGAESVSHSSEKQIDTGTAIGLILGILLGLVIAICFGAFIFFRRRRKHVDDYPPVVFENRYYGDAAKPLTEKDLPSDNDDDDNNVNVKTYVSDVNLPSMSLTNPTYVTGAMLSGTDATYDCPPPRPCGRRTLAACTQYDYPKSLGEWQGGRREENFYESLENLQNMKAALAMQEKKNSEAAAEEERYVTMETAAKRA